MTEFSFDALTLTNKQKKTADLTPVSCNRKKFLPNVNQNTHSCGTESVINYSTLSCRVSSSERLSTMASVMILLSSPSSMDPCLTGGSAGQRLGV